MAKANKMAEESNNEFHNVVPLQIRFNDVDKFGHVNNTIYFQFYDSGKTDYVSTVCKGFDWDQYAIFVVKIEVEFFAQIKGSDRIAVRTRTVKLAPIRLVQRLKYLPLARRDDVPFRIRLRRH